MYLPVAIKAGKACSPGTAHDARPESPPASWKPGHHPAARDCFSQNPVYMLSEAEACINMDPKDFADMCVVTRKIIAHPFGLVVTRQALAPHCSRRRLQSLVTSN